MTFAPEGIWFIAAAAFLAAVFLVNVIRNKRAVWISGLVVSLLLLGAMLFFFRDPLRPLPEPGTVVSPTDGRIIVITADSSGNTSVSMFLSLFDVHAIHSPVDGEVLSVQHFPGKFHPAYLPEAGSENEHVLVRIRTDSGEVTLKVFAGLVARRIVMHLEAGDEVNAGQRIGFIRFGSRSELIMPPGFDVSLKEGEHVKGGITRVGVFKPQPESPATDKEDAEKGHNDGA